jgi:S-adenosylmethionine:tRNA ribosyltransferase-isomerase
MTFDELRFTRPDTLTATEPPEARGLARDEVRLLVADGETVTHTRFWDLGRFLRPGDLVVVNTSATIAAAVDGVRPDGTRCVAHFSTPAPRSGDGVARWVIEVRRGPDAARPVLDAAPGERITLTGGVVLTLRAPERRRAEGVRLWRADVELEGRADDLDDGVLAYLDLVGRPITYGYLRGSWPLPYYQTVFAGPVGSAEMPSAGRPFTARTLAALEARGVRVVPIVLHCGVSSLENGESPLPERFAVSAAAASRLNGVRGAGGRVVAIGTTVVRALESAADAGGRVHETAGWTDLVIGPGRPVTAVDGLLTGWHEPGASHLDMIEAIAGRSLASRSYAAAVAGGYLWHEFGDVHLILP